MHSEAMARLMSSGHLVRCSAGCQTACRVMPPVVGSSRYITLGLPNKATARLSLLRMPPLYAPARTPPAATSFTCQAFSNCLTFVNKQFRQATATAKALLALTVFPTMLWSSKLLPELQLGGCLRHPPQCGMACAYCHVHMAGC